VAAELKEALGVEAELIKGRGGVFLVHVDGELVFDKAQTERFPDEGELAALVRKRMSKPG